jgi:hypothetical protein
MRNSRLFGGFFVIENLPPHRYPAKRSSLGPRQTAKIRWLQVDGAFRGTVSDPPAGEPVGGHEPPGAVIAPAEGVAPAVARASKPDCPP